MKLMLPISRRKKAEVPAPTDPTFGVALDGGNAATSHTFSHDNQHADTPEERPVVIDFGGAS